MKTVIRLLSHGTSLRRVPWDSKLISPECGTRGTTRTRGTLGTSGTFLASLDFIFSFTQQEETIRRDRSCRNREGHGVRAVLLGADTDQNKEVRMPELHDHKLVSTKIPLDLYRAIAREAAALGVSFADAAYLRLKNGHVPLLNGDQKTEGTI